MLQMILKKFYGIKNKKLQFPVYSGNKPRMKPLSKEHLSKSPISEGIVPISKQIPWSGQPRLSAIVRKLGIIQQFYLSFLVI
jgi:hypothetical protein